LIYKITGIGGEERNKERNKGETREKQERNKREKGEEGY